MVGRLSIIVGIITYGSSPCAGAPLRSAPQALTSPWLSTCLCLCCTLRYASVNNQNEQVNPIWMAAVPSGSSYPSTAYPDGNKPNFALQFVSQTGGFATVKLCLITSGQKAAETNCFDGLDNDCNGLTDSADPACGGGGIIYTGTGGSIPVASPPPPYYWWISPPPPPSTSPPPPASPPPSPPPSTPPSPPPTSTTPGASAAPRWQLTRPARRRPRAVDGPARLAGRRGVHSGPAHPLTRLLPGRPTAGPPPSRSRPCRRWRTCCCWR